MGVMGCFRNGCKSVMCDRYSSECGYICIDCFNELVDSGAGSDIKQFMNSEKKYNNKEASYARFDLEFPRV